METLHNHIILYDAECPMCSLYTGAFVRNGLLDAGGKEAYQQYTGPACPNLDWQRAVNEIALVNQATGEVTYGIASLLKVCGNAMPILAPLLRWKPFLWLAGKAYAFISYNRRVIVPAPPAANQFQYQPSFNIKYRIAWIVLAWMVTSVVLGAYPWIIGGYFHGTALERELTIGGGHILLQAIVVSMHGKKKTWDYLGNLMTLSLAGSIALFLATIICLWLNLGWYTCGLCFLAIAFLMIPEHLRRSRLLELGYWPTVTWILYRLIIVVVLTKYLS